MIKGATSKESIKKNLPHSIYLFYLYTLFNEGKTHLANIKLFYHVALSNKRNMYIKNSQTDTYVKDRVYPNLLSLTRIK